MGVVIHAGVVTVAAHAVGRLQLARRAGAPPPIVVVEVVDTFAVVVGVAHRHGFLQGRGVNPIGLVLNGALRVAERVVRRDRAQVGVAVLAHARDVFFVGLRVIRRKGEVAVASVVAGKAVVVVGGHSKEQDAVAVGELVAVLLRLVKRGHCRAAVRPVQPVLCGAESRAPRQLVVAGMIVRRKPALLDHRTVDLVRIVLKGVRLRPTMRYWRRGMRWRRRHRGNSSKAMGCCRVSIVIRRNRRRIHMRRSHTL